MRNLLHDNDPEELGRRYRAPALEKGLDVLELLAAAPGPLSASAIVKQLDRSHGEMFRMIQVLEYRGYIEPDADGQGYVLSDLLFSLGLRRPQTATILEVALPEMRLLAASTGQSCHLAMRSLGEVAVVARMESAEQIGFSVRIGYRRPIAETASGHVLFAFQPPDVRARWEEMFNPKLDPVALASFRAEADKIRIVGHARQRSRMVAGVIDLSAPVLRNDIAAAALTVPYLETFVPRVAPEAALLHVIDAAARITALLGQSDMRL